MSRKPVAVVTGASRGIGREIAKELARKGYQLSLFSRDKGKLEETKSECLIASDGALAETDILLVPTDMMDNAQITAAIRATQVQFDGKIDVLVANHGIHPKGRVVEQDFDTIISTNVLSTIFLVKNTLELIYNSSNNLHGKQAIIFVNSIAGTMGLANSAGYSASKHALRGFVDSIFEEIRKTQPEVNLKVSSIYPGFVNSRKNVPENLDPSKMIRPEAVAKTVSFILDADSSCCPTEIKLRPTVSPYKS